MTLISGVISGVIRPVVRSTLSKGVGAPAEPAVLLETGDDLLLESGEPLLLEA